MNRPFSIAATAVFFALSAPAPAREPARDTGLGDERPEAGPAVPWGRPSAGRVLGAVAIEDTGAVRILPRRHRVRCLRYGVPRLVQALTRAGEVVRKKLAGSPALG